MNAASGESPIRPARLFDPLERADFLRLEHGSYVKGLLRPFKGRGDMDVWASQCTAMRDGLIALAHQVLSQATAYPFNRLPVVLAQQRTGAGTTFIRWRSADRPAMGVALWEDLMQQPSTPDALVHELLALELQRVALNMQISVTHSLARQANECAAKMAAAEAIYLRRINQTTSTISKESTP